MKRLKAAFIMNIILFCLAVLSVAWMMSGVALFAGPSMFTASMFAALKYYTVESNILIGIAALWMAIVQRKVLKGKKKAVPTYCYVIKLVATAAVSLTMLITMFFLAPTSANWITLFMNSNFLMHLLNPLMAILVFAICERNRAIKLRYVPWGISTAAVYAVFYSINVLTHLADGQIDRTRDWYGFFLLGTKSVFIVVPIVLLIMYLISLGLWAINRQRKVKNQ